MPSFYNPPAVLPIEPAKRLLDDGRVISVLRFMRHEIPMPPLVYPEGDWRSDALSRRVSWLGHPEIVLLDDRIREMKAAIGNDAAGLIPATEREIFLLGALDANMQTVIDPVHEIIAAECDPAFLLPIDGRWRTYPDCVREYRAPDLEAARNAVRFIHTGTGWLDLFEQRLERRQAEARGAK